jgi:TM2 domain-containing membrane protein YozV
MTNPVSSPNADKKVAAGICGILIGAFGVHKFILGYTQEGVIMLLVSLVGGLVTCGIATSVMAIIGLIEGIMYLTKSDQEFISTYVTAKKGWF